MGRTVVVGDIHGCYDELTELLASVDLRPDDLLVSVGDLVDRGPAPGDVLQLFRDRPNSLAVMGNHERKHVRGIFSYAQEITRLQLGDRYAEWVDWMRALPYYYEDDEIRVVHAAMVSGVPLGEQEETILCGSTSGERLLSQLFADGHWYDHYTDAKPVAVGHHVTGPEPLIQGRVYCLDTGACHGWNLTALCVPDFTVHSVAARADHWSKAKKHWQVPVLKTRPWRDYTWQQIDEAVSKVDGAWPRAVNDWAEELRSRHADLVAEARRLASELPEDRLRQHPAARYLYQARAGKLTEAALERQCATPRATRDLAAKLGLELPDLPQ